MQLVLLGLVFVIGLFIFYLFNTRGGSSDDEAAPEEDDLKREENVIFLPDDLEKVKNKHKKK